VVKTRGAAELKRFLFATSILALQLGAAIAADKPIVEGPVARPVPAPYDWSGFYIGFTAGGSWGSFNPRSATTGLGYFPSGSMTAAVNALGSSQAIDPVGYAVGAEIGYNHQLGSLLLGVEADVQGLKLGDQANGISPYPFVPPGFFFQSQQYATANWMLTLRPRVGFVYDNLLIYGTGGLALTTLQSDQLLADNNFMLEGGKLQSARLGYSVGGGVEYALSASASLKVEYLFNHFDRTAAVTVANNLAPYFPATFAQSVDLDANIVRLGLNYRLDAREALSSADRGWLGLVAVPHESDAWWAPSAWEFETGARAWLSSGGLGAPQPLLNQPNFIASRLTFEQEQGYSYETFARLDHESGFFVKGFLGAGGITGGKMYDEDFPAGGAYSNTLQGDNRGSVSYGVFDVGYTLLRAPGAKVGGFVGYSYYGQRVNTYGCTQIASAAGCSPFAPFPGNYLGVAEDDRYHSLRVGLNAEAHLTDRLKATAEAAYLPYSDFRGHDDHNARRLLLPQAAQDGYGVMLEGVLSYEVAPNWNVGVGGRYWAWNSGTGTAAFDFLGFRPPFAVEPARFTTERFGGFVQVSHNWGDTTRTPKLTAPDAGPFDWTGFYLGGHLGGGWSDGNWSDNAPATKGSLVLIPSLVQLVNAPGFGDATHATGPHGGGQIGYNLQKGKWVFGVEADAAAANMRGDGTCFSGLGGVDCQHTVNTLGSVTGRVGHALLDRLLVYVKAGGAWANTTYAINADTNVLLLGASSTNVAAWGWTIAGGVEYALDEHWSFAVEYAHKDFAPTVSFSNLRAISAQNVSVHQRLDTLNLGVNHRFDLAPPDAILAKY
jgi:opacity protein-like surface antigen